MSQAPTFVDTIQEGWAVYQGHLVKAVMPLTPEQLVLRATPQHWTLGVLACHIAAARAYWLKRVMGEGDDAQEGISRWDDDGQPARSAGELVGALEDTWELMQDRMRRWTPAELAEEKFPRTYEGRQHMLTRQWILWHLLEHDLHHGGELSLMLGMHGLAALDL
jgi:uncharacterized damage-inducible protein DinB